MFGQRSKQVQRPREPPQPKCARQHARDENPDRAPRGAGVASHHPEDRRAHGLGVGERQHEPHDRDEKRTHYHAGEQQHATDAETTPSRDPELYRYDLNLRDIAEVWRRGSVIASWLLDLTATALIQDPGLSKFAGRVSDSGEGRWTIKAAIDEAVPTPVLTASLYERFSSRGEADYADKLLSAMRFEFGCHLEKPKEKSEAA